MIGTGMMKPMFSAFTRLWKATPTTYSHKLLLIVEHRHLANEQEGKAVCTLSSFSTGPPLLPGLIAASIWTASRCPEAAHTTKRGACALG